VGYKLSPRFIIRRYRVFLEVIESKQIELKINGMSCEHCEMRIKKALESVEGVQSVKADYKTGVAVVQADDSVSKESLVKAVNDTGLYTAQA
jgi:copper chaperone CopZ